MKINKKLIEKYNKPVPRYTSYPPANYFVDDFGSDKAIELIKESNFRDPQNISVYIHIPFCKRMCFYCGCNSCPMANNDEIKHYMSSLTKEIELVIPLLDKKRKISQIHYGGGTPNSIDSKYIREINQLFFDNFDFIEQPEIAIECHPGYLDYHYIDQLKESGFNRFSLGIQDFDSKVLNFINRTEPLYPIHDLVDYIRSDKGISVNLDFIYGLPGQSADSFQQAIEQAIDLRPDRLVTFSYAHVPWVNKNQKILEKRGLPSADEKIQMFENAYNLLTQNKYQMIGMDHYVCKDDELYQAQMNHELHRNFQGYCTRRTTGQVYAFGVSAISQLHQGYFQNHKTINNYILSIEEGKFPAQKGYVLNETEVIIREVIVEFMCNKLLDISSLSSKLNLSPSKISESLTFNEEKLANFEMDGIITRKGQNLYITEEGLLFIRDVAASLDPLMNSRTQSFSKSV